MHHLVIQVYQQVTFMRMQQIGVLISASRPFE
jgi:hypothetical protein